MFCAILFHYAHNVVFFSVRERNFKHLIASAVDAGANSVGAKLFDSLIVPLTMNRFEKHSNYISMIVLVM